MIADSKHPRFTVEQYLEWESHQEIRHEYIDGETYAITGGTIPHNLIALNLYTLLRPHLRQKGCRAFVADVKVPISSKGPYYYPDIIVSCDERDRAAIKLIQYPTLIVEVLAPGTENYDRGGKFAQYRKLSTLQEYVLIESEQVSVECYRRGEKQRWIYEPFTTGDTITLGEYWIFLCDRFAV
ncbi:Uma2 family endonuclease [Kovacikia minuta CCNUW1]|uniref:Uma2 family endonuclease n=1 Tax=Kovacikia minuta TaxID=2931930 RepID=UPI001CCD1714|nr:Uma2 family endonuclease [Kovacikia minuta]UBF28078.1 Uma2 family endonuclease [Kovacikia minuta CCNUW1]